MTYRTPRNWRWWLTIGINPQARHDTRHYIRRNLLDDFMAQFLRHLRWLEDAAGLPTIPPWQRDIYAASLASLGRHTHPHIRPGRHIVDPAISPTASTASRSSSTPPCPRKRSSSSTPQPSPAPSSTGNRSP